MANLHSFDTRDAARRFEAAAARGLIAEAREQRAELAAQAHDLAAVLRWLIEAGVSTAAINDAAARLHDAISDADALRCVTIDECGEWYDAEAFSDLAALIEVAG
jgi:hypothetical protein